MAEIRDDLILDIDQALRQIDQIERSLDTALQPIEVKVDPTTAQRQLDDLALAADRALNDVDLVIDPAGVQGLERAADGVTQALSRAEGEALDLGVATRDVERNLTDSEREALQLERALNRVDREADQVVRSTDRIASGFDNIRARAGLLVGIGAAVGIAGAVRLAGDARTAFADLQDSINAVKVVFGEASGPVLDFAENVAQTAGLSMAAFNQSASILGSSLLNVGFGAEEAARKTIDLTQRAADMASIFGGEVSVAVDAILSALRGEGNPIERFGVTLTEAKIKAEAASLGFKLVNGELDTTAKTSAILNIIMRETQRTAGDFAATAGDLANAQKIANSEFIDAKASLGEALLPVFQSFLDIAPELLGAIEDLAPSLSALAVSAGELATSTPGVLDFVDALRLLTDIPRGFGQIVDNARGMVEIFGTGSRAFAAALSGNFLGAFQIIQDGVEGLGDELQRTLERQNTQGLIDDLREGGDAAGSLADRLADVGKRGKLDVNFIRGLSQIAGLDISRNADVLKALIADADRLKLASDDVAALKNALAILNDELFGLDIEAVRELNRIARETANDPALPTIVTAFGELQTAADLAGVELGEFALSTDPMIAAMVEALDPADRLQVHLDGVAGSAEVAAGLLESKLRPALINAGDALGDINKDGETTVDEFIANLNEMAEAALAFKVDLATIFLISPELAAALRDLGPEAGGVILRGLQADPVKILEAEEALLGTTAGISRKIQQLVTQAIGLLQTNPAAVSDFTDFVTSLDIPGAADAVADDLNIALPQAFELLNIPALELFPTGIQGRETLIDGLVTPGANEDAALSASFADLDLDLTPIGKEGRFTIFTGLTTPQAGEVNRLRGSIVGTLDSAIQRDSPPKLFLDAGIDSGEAFWAGFKQTELTLKTAIPSITGGIAPGSMPGAGAGSTEINFNLPNLETRDADVTIARATQLAGSVAGILNGNFKL